MMKGFAFLFVSVVCLMGGVAMPTDLGTVTSGQSEEPCVWRSDIPVNNLTALRDPLNAVATWAHIAFNSTCWALFREAQNVCPYLKDEASKGDGYPRFSPQGKDTCDVQEVLRQATQVISESFHLIRQFSDDVNNQDIGTFLDLDRLQNRLDSAGGQLLGMIGDYVVPTPVVTIARDGDITGDNEQNVQILVRVELEVRKIIAAILHIASNIQN